MSLPRSLPKILSKCKRNLSNKCAIFSSKGLFLGRSVPDSSFVTFNKLESTHHCWKTTVSQFIQLICISLNVSWQITSVLSTKYFLILGRLLLSINDFPFLIKMPIIKNINTHSFPSDGKGCHSSNVAASAFLLSNTINDEKINLLFRISQVRNPLKWEARGRGHLPGF